MTVGLHAPSATMHASDEREWDAPRDGATVLRRRPEAELEDEETEDGDRTVAVARVLCSRRTYINFLEDAKGRGGGRAGVGKGEVKETRTYSCQREPERATEHDAEQREPSAGEANLVRQAVEGLLHARDPDGGDGARDDGVGDEAEGDDAEEIGDKIYTDRKVMEWNLQDEEPGEGLNEVF